MRYSPWPLVTNMTLFFASQTCVVVTTREIFLELVNQRLSQGFQLVVPKESNKRLHYDSTSIHSGRKSPISLRKDTSFTSTESTSPAYAKIPGECIIQIPCYLVTCMAVFQLIFHFLLHRTNFTWYSLHTYFFFDRFNYGARQ